MLSNGENAEEERKKREAVRLWSLSVNEVFRMEAACVCLDVGQRVGG